MPKHSRLTAFRVERAQLQRRRGPDCRTPDGEWVPRLKRLRWLNEQIGPDPKPAPDEDGEDAEASD